MRYPTRKHEPAPSTSRTRKINQPPMTRRSTTPATIHQRKLQTHATEIFKAKNSLSPEVMTEAPEIKEPYCSLCSEASHHGIQFMRHLAPRICNIVPQNIREPYWLNEFNSSGNLVLIAFVDVAKTTLLKWVLFDPTASKLFAVPFQINFYFGWR